ncbi:MAG: hypothetical protein ACLPKE_00300 [Streptosporangiaceae bacterium]
MITELHGRIAKAISYQSGDIFLASFVSKYLHFFCPIVPIYDSNAEASIGQYVDRKSVNPIRETITKLPEWARAYLNFIAAFVNGLHERASVETSLRPTVKQLGHMLWRPR